VQIGRGRHERTALLIILTQCTRGNEEQAGDGEAETVADGRQRTPMSQPSAHNGTV
jgi:hypothetical protein